LNLRVGDEGREEGADNGLIRAFGRGQRQEILGPWAGHASQREKIRARPRHHGQPIYRGSERSGTTRTVEEHINQQLASNTGQLPAAAAAVGGGAPHVGQAKVDSRVRRYTWPDPRKARRG